MVSHLFLYRTVHLNFMSDAGPQKQDAIAGCRLSSKTSCTFTLILQSAKVPKYHQSIKIRRRALKYQNIGCIDADFCADFAIFLHFSRSTRIICRKRIKLPENARILRTNFLKISENKHILILWLYSILWYLGGFLYFHFENFENLQPARKSRPRAPRWRGLGPGRARNVYFQTLRKNDSPA